jgi:SAM-dependent methyltransferase
MKNNNRISRRSCELYWGEAWLSLWRAMEARSLAIELIKIFRAAPVVRLLDAGSGDGRFYDLLSYAVETLAGEPLMTKVTGFGLERGPNRSAGMRRRRSPLIPVRGDMRLLPFDDAVMDLIVCNSTLEHISDIESVLGEFSRVLRPGGYLLFTVPSIRFEELLFRYRILRPIRKKTATRLAKAKSIRLSHLHYLHPSVWEQHLDCGLFSMVSWRSIVPGVVVAWGDILSTLRDIGMGGGQQSLRRPTRTIKDIPFRVKKRFCIEAEHLIARLSGCLLDSEIPEGFEGAYMMVAQRSFNTVGFRQCAASAITKAAQIPPKMISVNLTSPYAGKYSSHS